jgi:beta-lactamase regulating signal transducer with metallopeptidase domain
MHTLTATSLATSLAVLIVAGLRKPLRRIAGCGSAFWLWLLVPASALAVFVPAPAHVPGALPTSVTQVLSNVSATASASDISGGYVKIVLTIWLLGVAVMAILLLIRHRTFVRSLGRLRTGPEGVLCSDFISGPMVLGAWRARIIVPADFAARYTLEERTLMLAHERAHLERGDAVFNIIATGWMCVFWFNPLMYWAVGRLQFDQELACDARVINRRSQGRKTYATALLKAQMPPDSAWRTSVGCHWQSSHPLKERIAMLKYPAPGIGRRISGVGVTLALSVGSIYAVAIASGPVATDWMTRQITLESQNEKIRDVLLTIGRKTDHKIVFSDKALQKLEQPSQSVTLHFIDIQVSAVLDLFASTDGLAIKESGGVIYVDVKQP